MKHLEFSFGALIKLTDLTGLDPDTIFNSPSKSISLKLVRDIYRAARYNEDPGMTEEEACKEIDEAIAEEEDGFKAVLEALKRAMHNSTLFKKKSVAGEKKIQAKTSE